MSIFFIDGLDLCGANSELVLKGWAVMEGAVESTGGPFGTQSHSLTGNNTVAWLTRNFIRHTTVSFWLKVDTQSTTVIFALNSASSSLSAPSTTTSHFHFQALAGGAIAIGGDGVTHGTSAAGVIVAGTWHHIECQVDTNVSGNGKVYVDGGLVVNAAGDFTDASQTFSSIAFNGDIHFDDVVVQEDASTEQPLLGEHQIATLLPDANTAQADFTGVFTDIDDPFGSSDGDTTVISSATVTDKSEFGMGDLATTPSTIHAVQLVAEINKSDSGTKGATPYILSNVTRADSDELLASTTYKYSTKLHETDPDTAAAWATAGVNALKVGVEVTT
jgi:hypothetical protein